MKKKLVAMAACATASMVAHAQSAVTLYGILDEGVNWTSNSNGAHQYNMTSGVASGVDSTGKTAVAAINGPLSPSSSNQQSYVRVAIRHRF